MDRFSAAEFEFMMGGGGGESMMMSIPAPEPAITTEPEPETIPLEPEPEVSPDTLIQIIDFLDEVIAIHPDNAENIEDMRAILEDMLLEIENDYSTE